MLTMTIISVLIFIAENAQQLLSVLLIAAMLAGITTLGLYTLDAAHCGTGKRRSA